MGKTTFYTIDPKGALATTTGASAGLFVVTNNDTGTATIYNLKTKKDAAASYTGLCALFGNSENWSAKADLATFTIICSAASSSMTVSEWSKISKEVVTARKTASSSSGSGGSGSGGTGSSGSSGSGGGSASGGTGSGSGSGGSSGSGGTGSGGGGASGGSKKSGGGSGSGSSGSGGSGTGGTGSGSGGSGGGSKKSGGGSGSGGTGGSSGSSGSGSTGSGSSNSFADFTAAYRKTPEYKERKEALDQLIADSWKNF